MKLLNIFKNAIAGTNKNPPEQLHSQENIKSPQIKKCNFPGRLNGHPIQYAYAIDFTPLGGVDIIRDILGIQINTAHSIRKVMLFYLIYLY